MLKLDSNTKVPVFEYFKQVVKGTLGLQMFRSTDYSFYKPAGDYRLVTVRFSPKTKLDEENLKYAWKMIYKDLLEHGLCDPTYKVGYIPTPCIYKNSLIFTLDFYNL